jgi:hypothetical protein
MRSLWRAPFFFPLTLVLVGLVLLLNNYLLIQADLVQFWPLLLILIALQLLWRGDLAPSWGAQSFGITRGSVQAASLEVNSGEIDVRLNGLERAGRLIAGQYTARSRPKLVVRHNQAALALRRGDTWLFSLADWELGLAKDLPWAVVMSSHLGALQVDWRGLELRQAHLATGFGDIEVIAPDVPTGEIYLQSSFGDLQVYIPQQTPARIQIQAGPLARIIADERDFFPVGDGTYVNAAYRDQAEGGAQVLFLKATFGNVVLVALEA